MEVQRTLRIRLRPDPSIERLLLNTLQAYTASFNAVCEFGWTEKVFNGVELHKATYYTHRGLYHLPAQLACSARMKATEALKAVRTKMRKQEKASCPQSRRCAIRYDAKSYSIWFDRQEVTLVTLQGRIRLPFDLPEYYQPYATWTPTSADLVINRHGQIHLHVVMHTQLQPVPGTDEVRGVDLGIATPAADSAGHLYGSPEWKVIEDRILALCRLLQSKGTKSAKRHLKKLSGRLRRFRKDCDHVLSKRIVQSMEPGDTLALENLTDIRKRVKARKEQRHRLHSWSFRQLQSFIEYKALARSIAVAYVDPRYTSQKCSGCGHTDKQNRPTQALFCCRQCGLTLHADVNAALNIRDNYIRSIQRAAVNQPIASVPLASGASSVL